MISRINENIYPILYTREKVMIMIGYYLKLHFLGKNGSRPLFSAIYDFVLLAFRGLNLNWHVRITVIV